LSACRASLADCEADLAHTERRVEAAALPVLAGAVDQLLAEAASIREMLEAKLAEIDFVSGLLPPGSAEKRRIALSRPGLPPGVVPPDRSQHPALGAWVAAREALTRDPDAALPT